MTNKHHSQSQANTASAGFLANNASPQAQSKKNLRKPANTTHDSIPYKRHAKTTQENIVQHNPHERREDEAIATKGKVRRYEDED